MLQLGSQLDVLASVVDQTRYQRCRAETSATPHPRGHRDLPCRRCRAFGIRGRRRIARLRITRTERHPRTPRAEPESRRDRPDHRRSLARTSNREPTADEQPAISRFGRCNRPRTDWLPASRCDDVCRMRIALAALGDHDQFVLGSGFRQRAEYRFGLVLLLLLATFTFMAGGLSGSMDGCGGGAAARRDSHRRAFGRPSRSWPGSPRRARHARRSGHRRCTAPSSGREPNGFAALLSALLVGLAPIAIVWSIVRRRLIDVQTVLGALCIYVLLGMFWAFAFAAIGAFGRTPSSRRP